MNLSVQFFLLPFNQFDYQVPFLFSQYKLLSSFYIHKSLSDSLFHSRIQICPRFTKRKVRRLIQFGSRLGN